MIARLRPFGAVLLGALLLTACAEDGETEAEATGASASPSPSATVAADAFPVTIEHALGTTTIEEPPERIVTLSFEEDVLSQIGIDTVGHAESYVEPGEPYPWQEGEVDLEDSTAVTSVPNGEALVERIAALDPDLILATNYFPLPESYEKLSAVAPTVGYEVGWGEASWQATAELIGRAVGRTAQVAERIAEVQQGVADVVAEYPGLEGKTYAGAYYHASGQFAANVDPDVLSGRPIGEFGLVMAPELSEAVASNSLSMERLDALDADMLVVSFASPELEEELTSDPLFRQLDVVQDERVHYNDNAGAFASNNPTMLNVPWQLENYRDVLARAAETESATTSPSPTP